MLIGLESDIRDTITEDTVINKLKETRICFLKLYGNCSSIGIISCILSNISTLSWNSFIHHLMRTTDGSAELLDRTKEFPKLTISKYYI
jgi:hypothetical protein